MKRKPSSEYRLLTGLFFKLLPYQVLLLIITAVNGIVNSLYASNLIGQAAMTAIGLFGPLNHFLFAAAIIFVSGSQVLYGRYLARDRDRINHLFTVTLVISGAVGLLTSLLLTLSVFTGLSGVFVSAPEEQMVFNKYILGQVIGIPALILGQQLFSFMSLENRRRWTMAASILCFVVNIVCDQLFVAVFSWGTFGLGLATSVSEWAFFAALAVYYLAGKSEWHFRLRGCDWHDAPQVVKLGYGGALNRFMEMFRCLIVNFLILKYVGSVGLCSFAASNSAFALCWPVVFGMAAVARMLFSISVGEEDRRSLVDEMKIVMSKGVLVVLVMVAGLILLAEPLTRLFFRDVSDPVYHYTVMAFRLLPLCMPWSLWSLAYVAYSQAVEKHSMAVLLPVVDGLVGVAGCSLFMIPLFQMNGLYLSSLFNGLICALIVFIGAWRSLRRVPRGIEDQMAIPDSLGVGPEDRIDISVTSRDEVVEVSRRVDEFCRGRGLDARRACFASLCMEEMAGNIVEHGFSMDRKANSVDIRVVCKGDELILRIRDNCAAFDPSAYHRTMAPDEQGKNIGIRLVYALAKQVDYQNLLGMNVLTIRL